MKPFPRPSAGFCRQCLSFTRRSYTTSPPSPAALSALTARPPKLIPDYLTPMPSHLLTTTLSDLLSAPQTSTPLITRPHPIALPQGHHLVYFPIQTPPSQLAPDGADLDHSPGGQFVRRVWAGGEVRFRGRGLRLDCREALCREVVRDVVVKGEGEGMKVFVDVVREYGRGHEGEREEWDIEEVRTLVFMPPREVSDAPAQPKLIKVPSKPTHKVTITPHPHHLFHFSALSFNAHLIHIDPKFALSDGHPAPLVHGPLTLALMLRVLADQIGPEMYVQKFTYRNFAPLYVNQELSVCVREVKGGEMEVWVEGPGGGLAVRGRAVIGRVEKGLD